MDFDSKVVGVTRHNHDGSDRQVIAGECRAGEELTLRREPDNAQDANAVAVFRANGDQVGYLSASVAEQLAPLLDARAPITAVVSEVTGGTEEKPTLGVNIRIHDAAAAGNGKSAAAPDAHAAAPAEARPHAAPRPTAQLQARRGCLFGIVAGIGGLMKWATGG